MSVLQIVKSRDKRIDETRGGFVLSGKSEMDTHSAHSLLDKPRSLKRTLVNTLKLKKQRSTGDLSDAAHRNHKFSSSMRSTRSFASQNSTLSVESGMTGTSKHTDFSDDQSFYSQVNYPRVVAAYCFTPVISLNRLSAVFCLSLHPHRFRISTSNKETRL